MDKQSFEVDIQLDRIVLRSLERLLVLLDEFLLKDYLSCIGWLRLGFSLLVGAGLLLLDLIRHLQGGFLFLLVIEGRIVKIGHVLKGEISLNAEVVL